MDITERYLRSAADEFHQADMHLIETERYLRKLLIRLDQASSPSAHVTAGFSLRPVREPVAAGS